MRPPSKTGASLPPDSQRELHFQLDRGRATRSFRGRGYIRLSSVAELLTDPVSGKSPSPKSIYRWTLSGLRGHRLKTVRLPWGLCTTAAALDEFLDAINDRAPATKMGVQLTARRRKRQIEEARRQAEIIVNESRQVLGTSISGPSHQMQHSQAKPMEMGGAQ